MGTIEKSAIAGLAMLLASIPALFPAGEALAVDGEYRWCGPVIFNAGETKVDGCDTAQLCMAYDKDGETPYIWEFNLGEDCANLVSAIGAPATPTCGDAEREGYEACDQGANNGAGNGFCLADCSGVQVCGDGVRNGNEGCDDGNTGSGDGCSATCQSEVAGVTCDGLHADDGLWVNEPFNDSPNYKSFEIPVTTIPPGGASRFCADLRNVFAGYQRISFHANELHNLDCASLTIEVTRRGSGETFTAEADRAPDVFYVASRPPTPGIYDIVVRDAMPYDTWTLANNDHDGDGVLEKTKQAEFTRRQDTKGPDRIINTADDGTCCDECHRGPDGIDGTQDDSGVNCRTAQNPTCGDACLMTPRSSYGEWGDVCTATRIYFEAYNQQ